MSVFAGLFHRAQFSCLVSGSPQPMIQWYKDRSALPNEISELLVIESITLSNRGIYHCTATNSEGVVKSSSAVLNVAGIQQYIVPVLIPIPDSNRFQNFGTGINPSPELLAALTSFVMDLNEQGTRRQSGDDDSVTILIYSISLVGGSPTLSPSQ